ncbi:MAG: hypothetical protein LBS10_06435, partial [Gracilibacteraceae bacterium]|nr:hypothetical protein [Gracilibacteraceae bacterium]
LYIRLIDYIQQRTLMSMGIAVVTAILMEILASFFADKALGGSIIERVLSTIGPLMVLCILVMPFFNKKNR